jgi:hypothetical protein
VSESTPSPQDINEALLILQADPPLLTKQRQGQVGNQKTKYADLPAVNAQVLTKLNALGVIWRCVPTLLPDSAQGPGRFVLRYSLLHVSSHTSIDGDYPLGAGEPQKMGSAITYARRYALLAVTGIAAEDEDDDGQGGTAQRAPRKAAKPREESTVSRNPAAPSLPGEPAVGGAKEWTQPMMRKWMAQNREAGIEGDAVKAVAADMLGRQVASSKEITFDEMRGMIDAFEKALKDRDTAAATVIDIYQRTTGGGAAPAETPPPRKQTARKATPPARSTRESVTGTPAGPADEAPPWETEPPADPEWPETAVPGGAQ